MIQAARPDPIGVRVVHLDLEAFGREPPRGADVATFLLILGQYVDAAVRAGARHDVHLQLEVAEAVVTEGAVVVAVACRALGDDGALLDGEGFGRPSNLPASEVAAVEQGCESRLDDQRSDLRSGSEDRQKETDDGIHDVPGQRSDVVLAVLR